MGLVPIFLLHMKEFYRTFSPYSHKEVQSFHVAVSKTFGKIGQRWSIHHVNDDDPNVWKLCYQFEDPNDGLLFALKFMNPNLVYNKKD
jgi:hypothetical protein